MSPSRACHRHGRVKCQRCAGDARARARATRRPYSGTAEERRMRLEVLETYGDRCHYCARPINLEAEPRADDALVLAHLTAHRDGGAFTLENLRPSHTLCNLQAGAAHG